MFIEQGEFPKGATYLHYFSGPLVFWNSALSKRQPKVDRVFSENLKRWSDFNAFAFYPQVFQRPCETVIASGNVPSPFSRTRLGKSRNSSRGEALRFTRFIHLVLAFIEIGLSSNAPGFAASAARPQPWDSLRPCGSHIAIKMSWAFKPVIVVTILHLR